MLEQGIIAPFAWEVAKGGYRWMETRGLAAGTDRWLTTGEPLGGQWETRQYDPMDSTHSALFRNFAYTEPTEPGILKFATKYGLLVGAELIVLDQDQVAAGESIGRWRMEIQDMNVAVRVWDALEAKDADTLRRTVIAAKENDTGLFSAFATSEVEPYAGVAKPASELLAAGVNDLIKIARIFLQEYVNDHMSLEVEAKLLYMPSEGNYRLTIRPKHLLSMMWLQLARAIAGNKEYRPCKVCGTWFEVSLEKNRKSKLYCEDKCKTKLWRDNNPAPRRRKKAPEKQ